jgi:hypothetical protein
MQTFRNQFNLLALALFCLAGVAVVWAQAPAFSYQGRLTDGGVAANGAFDLQFRLFDALAGGAQQGPLVSLEDVAVVSGIFTVTLDFGAAAFPGAARWLEISMRPGASVGAFVVLSPRQSLNSTPYAVRSLNAGTAALANALSAACVNCVTSGQIGGVNGSQISGAIPVASVPAGSGNYVQNTTTQQTTSNFNISGDGTAGGTLAGNIINATTQYNLGGNRVLSVTGSNNVFAGIGAGAANTTGNTNTFIGRSAGAANTSGNFNSFFGAMAGAANTTAGNNAFFGAAAGAANTIGDFNAFFGRSAGAANTTGNNNAFFGALAGDSNTTGFHNTFIGALAGDVNSTGGNNSFIGALAGTANTAGSGNAFIGAGAGDSNTTGFNNAFIGAGAGDSNTTGFNNAFIGSAAGLNNTSGSGNTIFGSGANVITGNLSNATALGAMARVDCSNCLVLGSVAGFNGASLSPNVGIGTTAPATNLEVVNNGGSAAHVFTTSYGAVNNAIVGRQAGGSLAAPSATASGLSLLFLGGRGHTGAGFATVSRVGVNMEAAEDWTATANGTRITLDTTQNGSTSRTERMRIDQNGRVGIGTTSPVARLHVYGPSPNVQGVIRAETDTTDVLSSHFAIVGLITTNVPGTAVYGGKAGGVGAGVEGAHGSFGTGVYGHSGSEGVGVNGVAFNGGGVGVRGGTTGMGGLAGSFNGDVEVTGTLSKGGGAFKIDHPLDPANKYLYHSFVESPDMKNIYDGNVTTDAVGEAVVVLPDWFEALNRDFRYQLTVLGQFAQAIIAEKIKDNRFKIRTSLPNVEVSWQVTGIRQDAFAERHRIPVEQVKPEKERGSYLHPEAFGQPAEKGVEWALRPEMMREMKEQRAPAKQSAPPAKSGHEKP